MAITVIEHPEFFELPNVFWENTLRMLHKINGEDLTDWKLGLLENVPIFLAYNIDNSIYIEMRT